MKVLVKNNLLLMQGDKIGQKKKTSLADYNENDLARLARKYQIGLQTVVKKKVQKEKEGRTITRTELVYTKKPRVVLEEEIKERLTMCIDIPKEYWTEKQKYAWDTNYLGERKEISEVNPIKQKAGILKYLPPYEEGKGDFESLGLLAELTESQWGYLNQSFNQVYKWKDENERKVKERKYLPHLIPHEWIPEGDEDLERLSSMTPKTNAVKLSIEKYCKKDEGKSKKD